MTGKVKVKIKSKNEECSKIILITQGYPTDNIFIGFIIPGTRSFTQKNTDNIRYKKIKIEQKP